MEAVRRIQEYVGTMSYEQFRKDIRTQDAVMRNLEILGEAAKNISAVFRKKHANVPWKQLAGLRDRLIHHYFGVNLDIVWGVIQKELPDLTIQIKDARKHYLF